jgi:hypothetical protein
MPAAATIALLDALGTPVNHNFVPNGKDAQNVFWYVDRSLTNAIGYWKISVEFKEPPPPKAGENSAARTFRVRIGLHEPVLETLSNSTVSGITAAPTVGYIPRSFVEYIMPERSVLLDRQNLRKMTYNLQANTQIIDVVEKLERIWTS